MPRRPVDVEELQRLTATFRELGAEDPESWARSQLSEGIPQLAIFCFAKALWEGVVSESDTSWIDSFIAMAHRRPNDPCSQSGPALEQMLSSGVSRETITDLVRVVQYETLYHVALLLEGAIEPSLPIRAFSAFEVDADGSPVTLVQGVHEVLLSLDPTRREMRPRNDGGVTPNPSLQRTPPG